MPFNPQLGIFDDEQFNNFSKDKELVSVKLSHVCGGDFNHKEYF